MFWAKRQVADDRDEVLAGDRRAGLALNGTLVAKARAPERPTVIEALPAFSPTVKLGWVKKKVESSLRTLRFAMARAPRWPRFVGLLSDRATT